MRIIGNALTVSVIGAIGILMIVGCGALKTRSVDDGVGGIQYLEGGNGKGKITKSIQFAKGVPYHLPKTLLKVTLESVKDPKSKTHKNLLIKVEPLYVPDPNYRFVLRRDPAVFFARKDSVKVKGGLLQSVDTTDDSKIDDFIRSIASTALTLSSGIPVSVGTEAEFRKNKNKPPVEPTSDEKDAVLGTISPGEHTFTGALDSELIAYPSSTGKRITLRVELKNLEKLKKQGAIPTATSRKGAKIPKSISAILTKTTLRREVEVKLVMSRSKLYEDRIYDDTSLLESLGKSPAPKETKIPKLTGEINTLDKQIVDSTRKIKDFIEEGKIEEAAKEKAKKAKMVIEKTVLLAQVRLKYNEKYTILLKNNKLKEDIPLLQSGTTIAVTDDSAVFAVSVKPAAFGVTKHTLTFVDGVLTDTDVSRPSSAHVIAKVPVDIAKAIVDIPARLLTNQQAAEDRAETLRQRRQTAQTERLSNEKARLDNEAARLANEKARKDLNTPPTGGGS